jgi:hypothetical protein
MKEQLIAPARTRQGLDSAWTLAKSAIALSLSFLVFFPPFPSLPSAVLDPSWRMALNEAWARGLNFTHDIVFTYGPYSFLETGQYHPATYTALLWCSCLLGAALFLLLRYVELDSRKTSVAFIILPCLIVSGYTSSPDVRFLCFAFLLLVAAARPPRSPVAESGGSLILTAPVVLNLASFCLGLICLVKATHVIEVGIMGALSMAALYTSGRRLLAIAILMSFVLGLTLFWLIAGQPLADLPHFFINQGQLAAGYGQAMSTVSGPLLPVLFLLSVVPLAVAIKRDLQMATVGKYMVAVGLTLTVFLGFKEGFVREDYLHVMTAAEVLLIVPWCWQLDRMDFWRAAQVVMAAGTAIVCAATYPGALDIQGKAADLGHVLQCFGRDSSACPLHAGWLDRAYERSLARIRAQVRMPQVQGSVDVYTERQSLAIAYGYRWDPRPVIQSYGAYTPALARMNADHLLGARAPDGVLFSLEAVDTRLPALADGPSWPILLSRYALKSVGVPADLQHGVPLVYYLQHKPDWRRISVVSRPALEGAIRLGQRVDLPRIDGPLFAQIDIRQNTLGALADALLNGPRLYIEFLFPDGHTEHYRFIPGAARAGFIISPVVIDSTQFVVLGDLKVRQPLWARRPVAFSLLGTARAPLVWSNRASVRISSLSEVPD